MLESYESFTAHLADREYFGQKLGLEKIQAVLRTLGNPEKKFPSIHIAGTNGKGSTAIRLASILKEAGYRVGLYTSPHLEDFCERIKVGGEFILPDQIPHYARVVREIEEEPLTFFELATAIAFLHFAESKVDIAVLEVGMGGRLDATNVVTPLVSVITSIGYDHMQFLGDTLEKIAFEKAGIIKPGIPVVVGELPGEAMGVIRNVVLSLESHVLGFKSETPDRSIVQELRRQGWAISDQAFETGFANAKLPGRLETVRDQPWIVLDGGHNPDAMRHVRKFLEPRLEGRRLTVLFGAMADKDLGGMLSVLAPITDEFIFTSVSSRRAASPEGLIERALGSGKRCRTYPNVTSALEAMLEELPNEEALLITGSFYLVGEARKLLRNQVS